MIELDLILKIWWQKMLPYYDYFQIDGTVTLITTIACLFIIQEELDISLTSFILIIFILKKKLY